MSARDDATFETLLDRHLTGEALSPEDERALDALLAEDPARTREAELLASMSELDGPADDASAALVDSVMAELTGPEGAGDERDREEEDPVTLRPGLARRFALVASAAAVLAVGLWTQLPPGPAHQPQAASGLPTVPTGTRLELVYRTGDVRVDGSVASTGDTLALDGEEVVTGAGGACFVMEPGIDLCLDANSRLRVDQLDRPQRRLSLVRGRVALRLDKQPQGTSITVRAGGVESTAIGTAFSVQHADGGIATTVMEGRVRVEGGKRAQLVAAHERVTIERDGEAVRDGLTRAQESVEWGALSSRRLWRGEISGELVVEGAAAGAEVLVDGRAIGALPLSSLLPVGNHTLAVRRDGELLHREAAEIRPGVRHVVRVDLPPPLPEPEAVGTQDPAPKRPSVPTPTELLSGARHMMVEGRWEDAAGMYRALQRHHPRSPEARTVLVSLSQLELDRLGQPGKALSLLDRYLSGGTGTLEQEARFTRIRALRRLKLEEAERDAIGLFLSTYPKSFHTQQLRERLQALQATAP